MNINSNNVSEQDGATGFGVMSPIFGPLLNARTVML